MTVAHSNDYITICEFMVHSVGQVPPPPPPPLPNNVAAGKPTSQSTNGWGSTDGGRAVDGDTNGQWGGSSCTHTQAGDPEWWQVDLGESMPLNAFNIYHRTDCCQDRLVSAHVWVSDTTDYTAGGVECQQSVSGGNSPQPERGQCGGVVGQFVTVQHASDYITICEFEISGGDNSAPVNVALNKDATQSTEGWSGAASRGVDGNTATAWGEATCTHTQNGDPEWWQVNLGGFFSVTELSLYHRTDCCQDRLVGARIMISDTNDYTSGSDCYASTAGGNTDQPEVGTCEGAVGQFLTVVHANDYITICEFEAIGVAAGVGR
jgi:hypothetical protein